MRALLHPDLSVRGHTLHDTQLDCGYTLTPDAAWVIAQLAKQSNIQQLIKLAVRAKSISQLEAAAAVYDTCGQLGRIGGLQIKWGESFHVAARMQAYASWRQRRPVTPGGFVQSMLRAYGFLCIALIGLCIFGKIMYAELSWWLLAAPIGVFASCVMHEAGHIAAAKQARVAAVLLSSVGYMALLYRRPARRVMRRIAAAGPLLVILSCVIGLIAVRQPFIRFVLIATACTHALCLLPFCADGKTIWGTY